MAPPKGVGVRDCPGIQQLDHLLVITEENPNPKATDRLADPGTEVFGEIPEGHPQLGSAAYEELQPFQYLVCLPDRRKDPADCLSVLGFVKNGPEQRRLVLGSVQLRHALSFSPHR